MSEIFQEGDAILFMKVGTHANEPLEEIILRKRREIEDAGFSMWGYGGSTCHPRTMVQPFASAAARDGKIVRLCMRPMDSRHFAEKVRAGDYSVDGVQWQPVPKDINVLGSRFALCITDLEPVSARLDLERTRVAVGRSQGRVGNDYLRGHVDKACLEVGHGLSSGASDIPIGLVATLVEPYAVLLR